MSKKVISIVIPCYNHGQYIDEAIESVENNTKIPYELIIVNDGSTDDFTNKRLIELSERGYHVIFQDNQGLGKTRNNGIRIAQAEYILPLDADNKIKPEYISKAVELLNNNKDISIVYSDRQTFGQQEEVIKVGAFNTSLLLARNTIDACAVFRKSMWTAIGGYDENMPTQGWEDWDFWISSAKNNFKFHYIPEPLYYYRVAANSMIHNLLNHPDLNMSISYIYKKHLLFFIETYKNCIYGNIYAEEYSNSHPLRESKRFFLKWIKSQINILLTRFNL